MEAGQPAKVKRICSQKGTGKAKKMWAEGDSLDDIMHETGYHYDEKELEEN